MEADWDLLAVVRGCTSSTITASTPSPVSTAAPSSSPAPLPEDTSHGRSISPSGFQDLQDSYKPFPRQNHIPCPLDGSFNFEAPQQRNQLQPPQGKEHSQVIFGSTASSASATTTTTTTTTTSTGSSMISVGSLITSHSQRNNLLCASTTSCFTTPHTQQRSKKRNNLQKRVCHLAAEGISSDMWAWRKYGQKPIKGSPYPRGYYKCSSSKGCPARKQVERNRLDPKMFIVTYTSEHNHPMPTHRNSLAGSTRHKASGDAAASPGLGSPVASFSPAVEEKGEIKEGDCGDEMEFKNMVMNDDFFVGFEELDDSDGGFFFPDQIQGGLEMGCPLT